MTIWGLIDQSETKFRALRKYLQSSDWIWRPKEMPKGFQEYSDHCWEHGPWERSFTDGTLASGASHALFLFFPQPWPKSSSLKHFITKQEPNGSMWLWTCWPSAASLILCYTKVKSNLGFELFSVCFFFLFQWPNVRFSHLSNLRMKARPERGAARRLQTLPGSPAPPPKNIWAQSHLRSHAGTRTSLVLTTLTFALIWVCRSFKLKNESFWKKQFEALAQCFWCFLRSRKEKKQMEVSETSLSHQWDGQENGSRRSLARF